MAGESPVCEMLQEWKRAESLACEAEVALFRAYVDFLMGQGPEPSQEQQQTARALRRDAAARYTKAMAAVDLVLEKADDAATGKLLRQFGPIRYTS